ncbi:hypothetical protein Pogu_1925 [Pyrobaculum oguniense TE7]|uniref:Uncharacterized protein n=1 Tax=Pyrobaculum oguniense (strain DSM 13380 / JCM 10595 / TE7) TaxID=698757 RepID=H6QCI4_PYROT|nr:hypothetical protein Pogu_1925 [Pyrobaculum oguniense TE7]
MIELLSALKKLLRGEIKIDLDSGVMAYKGRRVVAIPADVIYKVLKELDAVLAEGSLVVLEKLGYAMGAATTETMGWSNFDDVAKELPQLAKVGGFGRVKLAEDIIEMEELPVPADPAVARYLSGFLRALCMEPVEMELEGDRIRAKIVKQC